MKKIWVLLLLAANFTAKSQNQNMTLRSVVTYPSETLANVCGYWKNGKEYALVGAAKGMSIVDITNPAAPQKLLQIPGPNNLWKEIKTFRNFAYSVSEGGFGVQIIDLQKLPATDLPFKSYKGDGAIANNLNRIHALHIDTTSGFLYAFGSNLYNGGAVVLSLLPDPWNPVFVGKYDSQGYIHDGFVDNDTLFACHIYTGQVAIVDFKNKANPKILGTFTTPGQFTHNAWLTRDRKTILTTDEVNNSSLTAYDVSDPAEAQILDLIKSNPGSQSMVHNTHILNDFAVTSWYKDGFTVVDIADPSNLVQVGNYDTYNGTGGGSNGCWGVYPFFPSGTIIASNISAAGTSNGELFILSPTYVRAARLDGLISNGSTSQPLSGAKVEIVGMSPQVLETTIQTGIYKMGIAETNRYLVRYSKTGFRTVEQEVFFQSGQTTHLDVELFPTGNFKVFGKIKSGKSGEPLAGATVNLLGSENLSYEATTDADGNFEILNVAAGMYDISASSPSGGSQAMIFQRKILQNTDLQVITVLPKGNPSAIKLRQN